MIVWQNGSLVSEEEVLVSPFDSGLTIGEGVFETMLAVKGKVFAWERHLSRLEQATSKIGMPMPTEIDFETAMEAVLEANPECAEQARVRVTLTAGGVILITAVPVNEPELTTITVVTVDVPINQRSPLTGVKTLSYAENFIALRTAQEAGASEGMRANLEGTLCEACLSNVFFVKDGAVHTPALETGCLPGVTRDFVLEILPEVEVGSWDLSVLNEASEIWLTSSIRRLQWVSAFDGRALGDPSTRFDELRNTLDGLISIAGSPY